MQEYRHVGGETGILAFEIGTDFIRVEFEDHTVYIYTYASAGSFAVERMKELAVKGEGLNTFINKYTRKNYERKER